jgi:hypothetical protein
VEFGEILSFLVQNLTHCVEQSTFPTAAFLALRISALGCVHQVQGKNKFPLNQALGGLLQVAAY